MTKKQKDIPSEIKCIQQVTGRLTFDLDPKINKRLSFVHPSFEYEVKTLNIAKIQSYCTSKILCSWVKIDLILNISIPFEIFCQYKSVEQSDRLNYGMI